ncbi:MAG: hypothetical protein IKM30_04590 [Oscillospiraceae bacterium]|nr:hypothetical protein [Oscillospiraceae bacterium]
MADRGKNLAAGVGIYMLLKQILNGIIGGFGFTDLIPIGIAVAAIVCLWTGVKRSNLIVGIYLMLLACTYLPQNLKHIGLNVYLLYTLEGLLDMAGAVLLAFHPAVRSHCKLDH